MQSASISSSVKNYAEWLRTGARQVVGTDGSRRVLVVGSGPLARATCEDIELRGGSVLGYLAWQGEGPANSKSAKVMGTVAELGAVLSQHRVAEVFLAAPRQHLDELEEAVRTCEQKRVRFAVPAVPFRLTRGRPRGNRSFPDGYIHFVAEPVPRLQVSFARWVPAAVYACALWVLAPVLSVLCWAIAMLAARRLLESPRVG